MRGPDGWPDWWRAAYPSPISWKSQIPSSGGAGLVFSLVGAKQPEFIDGDRWPYGIEPNRPTLEALVRHLHEQNFIRDIAPIEDFFVPT